MQQMKEKTKKKKNKEQRMGCHHVNDFIEVRDKNFLYFPHFLLVALANAAPKQMECSDFLEKFYYYKNCPVVCFPFLCRTERERIKHIN